MISSIVPLDLSNAVELIVSKTIPACSERINLKRALGRISASAMAAQIPQPEFDQSIRDGFVIRDRGNHVEDSIHEYAISGEIAAGSDQGHRLLSGSACRIMTGGMIPSNGIRVVPFENCREADRVLFVPEKVLAATDTYIRSKGSAISTGQIVLGAGEKIDAGHLSLLAATGLLELDVYRKAMVVCFSTGSELLLDAKEMKAGMKISSNRYLLNGLVGSMGAHFDDKGVVRDSLEDISRIINSIDPDRTDIIISTGGMGPGKYDLLERAFVEAGGQVFYQSLNVRPGKATLFGLLGSSLFFGLPGPPTAVQILFNELIVPALSVIQGDGLHLPVVVNAFLAEDYRMRAMNVLQLKGGRLSLKDGKCMVRSAVGNEPLNCIILFHPKKEGYEEGEMVPVHLAGSATQSSSLTDCYPLF